MPKICLYAEVLTHIRQLTLHATLQTDGDETPRIDVSSDKQVITVVHGGESSSLWLPTQILGTANVTFLTPKKTELTARVQIDDAASWKEFDQSSIEAPWDALDLSNDTIISCKICRATVLSPGKIETWKDLPSQDWADVMDLWYCHKPHEQPDSDRQKSAAEAKGFSARSRLASKVGIGMIDITSFVLHPGDCENIQIPDRSNENEFKPVPISCSGCATPLGTFSASEDLIRLQKADVIVKAGKDKQFVSFDASTFICAQLLSLIESSSLRKVVVYSLQESGSNSAKDEGHSVGNLSDADQERADKRASRMKKDLGATGGSKEAAHTNDHGDDFSQLYSTGSAVVAVAATTSGEKEGQSAETMQSDSKYRAATVEEAINSPVGSPSSTSRQNRPSSTAQKRKSPHDDVSNNGKPSTREDEKETEGLLLWIFNPNIYYSSSLHPANITTLVEASSTSDSNQAQQPAHAHRAMKVFYKVIKNPTSYLNPTLSTVSTSTSLPSSTSKQSDSQSHTQSQSKPQTTSPSTSTTPQTPSPRGQEYEDLPLPTTTHLQNLLQTLQNSTKILPQNAQKFQDWTVGLLDRYEKIPTAKDAMGQNPLARRPSDDIDLSFSTSTKKEEEGKEEGKETVVLPAGYHELYL